MFEYMNDSRFAGRGDKVRFLDRNGYEHDLKQAREVFVKGQILTVTAVDVGNWSSNYTFEGIKGGFNTVMFASVYNNGKDPSDKGLGEPKLAFEDTWAASDAVVFEHWFDKEYTADAFSALPNIMRLAIKEVAFKAFIQGWKKAKNVH